MTVRTAYPATESNGDTLTTTNFDKLPGGWIGYAEIASNSGLTGISSITAITGLSVTVTVNTSRRIEVRGSCGFTQQTGAGRVKIYIVEGGTTLKTFGNNTQSAGSSEGQQEGSVILTPSAGSHTYSLSISTTANTVDVTVGTNDPGPAFILVNDLGPA